MVNREAELSDSIEAAITTPDFADRIDAAGTAELVDAAGGDADAVLLDVSSAAARFAVPPLSRYRVGVAALGESGAIYIGANLEFADSSLSNAVHAEQTAVVNAVNHSERRLTRLAVHAAPCGHCRQFLVELVDGLDIVVLVPGAAPASLAELLPNAFTPAALESDAAILGANPDVTLATHDDDELVDHALSAARRSHAPYSGSPAGASVLLEDGSIVRGPYLESVAFNPTMGALRSACAAAQFRGWPDNAIRRAAIVARSASAVAHIAEAESLLAGLPGSPELTVATALPAG